MFAGFHLESVPDPEFLLGTGAEDGVTEADFPGKESWPFFFSKYLFIYGSLGLHCCTWTFSSCIEQGATLWSPCAGFSWWWLLLWSTGSRVLGLQELRHVGSVSFSSRL